MFTISSYCLLVSTVMLGGVATINVVGTPSPIMSVKGTETVLPALSFAVNVYFVKS